jgi:SAM-dependent methyltransferase
MALSASDEELDLTMTLGSRRRHARRAVARVLPPGLKRALHRMIDGGRAFTVRAATQKRTTGAPPVPVAAPLPPLDMTAHIPRDHARQVGSQYYIQEAMRAPMPANPVMDLGCGDGASAELFRSELPDVRWVGVDIVESATVWDVQGEDVVVFDGVHLPFSDDSFPLVYTNQVFEHVRHPQALLLEIRRVLTPGGVFIGSVSQLEPYHAFSLWGGYTLYGWATLCRDAGLILEEARPSIDSRALITRQYEGAPPEHARYWELSPLNVEIDEWAVETDASVLAVNARKLQFCGQFAFRVRRPLNTSVS